MSIYIEKKILSQQNKVRAKFHTKVHTRMGELVLGFLTCARFSAAALTLACSVLLSSSLSETSLIFRT